MRIEVADDESPAMEVEEQWRPSVASCMGGVVSSAERARSTRKIEITHPTDARRCPNEHHRLTLVAYPPSLYRGLEESACTTPPHRGAQQLHVRIERLTVAGDRWLA